MNPIRKAIYDLVKPKMFDPLAGLDIDKIGWHKTGSTSSTYDFYKSSDYENAYPSISKIANAFLTIEPYAIDEQGEPTSANVVDRLYSPNKQMSAAEFREALVVMSLVHPKVYIRAHHTGNRVTADNINGYSFLEGVVEVRLDGKTWLQLPDGEKIDDSEVLVLKNLNPDALGQGFSPTQSARKWINLDDYIAAYQSGFFENGAVPAGQFIITAPSVTEYNDIVDMLVQQHKGAGKNNNVTYAHRAVDPTGKPLNANIEWVPFNSSNSELALKEIFEQANQKIDSVYGVPASIRGVNDNNTYASVRTDEVVFMKYVVDPLALKLWDKFNHELNRVTGGTGVAIEYELEIPQIAEEEKAIAETKKTDMETISAAVKSGFELESVIEALEYPETYKKLKYVAPAAPVVAPTPDEEEEEVLEEEEVEETPDASKSAKPRSKRLTEWEQYDYEYKLGLVLRDATSAMVERAQDEVEAQGSKAVKTKAIEPDQDEQDELAARMLTVIMPMVIVEGQAQLEEALNMLLIAGINDEPSHEFALTTEQRAAYAEYIKKVGTSYSTTTAAALRAIMVQGYEQGLSADQIKQRLSDVMSQQWRIDRVTHTEINRMGAQANVDSMKNVADELNITIEKIWTHSGGDTACNFCKTMVGQSIDVHEDYLPLGEGIVTEEGEEYVNDFHPVSAGSLHPNCHCRSTFRVRR